MSDLSTKQCRRPVSKTRSAHMGLDARKQRINRELIHANAAFMATPPVRSDRGCGALTDLLMA
jgi:hypothetical protein